MKVPAQFKYNGVIDLLCDAVLQCRLAAGTEDSYTMNRHARASILSSILALESAGNALLLSLGFSAKFADDLDKLPVLAKFEVYLLRLGGEMHLLDRGVAEVQRVQELLRARNDYVHSKVKLIPTEISPFEDQGDKVALPLELAGERWPAIGIPKIPMFWSADSARSALASTVAFLRMVVRDHAKLSPDSARYILHSRLEIGETHVVATFDEFLKELTDTTDLGVSFEFLGFPGHAAE
jgi:hypothetical protein